jgi:CspA family cold shock protein
VLLYATSVLLILFWKENMSKEIGHVKWFNDVKGYGFISRDNGQEDVFVHFNAIVSTAGRKTLQEGQRVEFKVTKGAKGLQAEEVTAL